MNTSARRLYLSAAVKLLFLIALVALAAVLLASLGSGDGQREQQAAADPWRLEVDWSQIPAGELRQLQWPDGREIWVYRRPPGEIQRLEQRPATQLRDPDSHDSRQPRDISTAWRSHHPQIFVFHPYETRRGCRVRLAADKPEFVDACHGARFDSAGRLLEGSGVAEQQNLSVPDYELIGAQRLRLEPPGNGT
ncbi:MAG: hypothetical protein RI563_07500 [Thiohalophilus sp.]|uniref:hypothetical protein n=1 Tax=Thiohalophilus sp. TaxID=3028392 RepID=UPI0028709D9B|nr:hypothetical protein [Thiohalophilus sp.]MDR9436711.1 hypothetical protein [Thiohalophilus sp.]